jgi:hypothetical protein
MALATISKTTGVRTVRFSNGSRLAVMTICAIGLSDYWVARQMRINNIKINSVLLSRTLTRI